MSTNPETLRNNPTGFFYFVFYGLGLLGLLQPVMLLVGLLSLPLLFFAALYNSVQTFWATEVQFVTSFGYFCLAIKTLFWFVVYLVECGITLVLLVPATVILTSVTSADTYIRLLKGYWAQHFNLSKSGKKLRQAVHVQKSRPKQGALSSQLGKQSSTDGWDEDISRKSHSYLAMET